MSATYRIETTSGAARDLKALPDDVRVRVDAKLLEMRANARPPGTEKMQGQRGPLYRARVGDYRIVYKVTDPPTGASEGVVEVARVRHRREVYRGL